MVAVIAFTEATVLKTTEAAASVASNVATALLSVCPVCNVGVLWPNGLTDQDETSHAGRPWPWPHCVRWGPSSPPPKPMFINCDFVITLHSKALLVCSSSS